MSLAVKPWKVYLRMALVVGVAAGIGLVLLMNRGNSAPVWFFWLTDSTKPMNVTWLMLCTAFATLFSWWSFSFARGLWRDAKEVRAQTKADLEAIERSRRERELAERERRLDDKLKRAGEALERTESNGNTEEERS